MLLTEFVDLDAQVRPGLAADAATKANMLSHELVAATAAAAERTLEALQADEAMLRAAGEAWPEDAHITAGLAIGRSTISACW